MSLVVYNTLTREKQPFEPVRAGKVGIYLCGPTVYKPSHIGHAVGPIIFDAVKRYLVHRGFDVTWVVNITDVDDKLIDEAARRNISTMQLAERVTEDYLKAMAKLHVETIDVMPKASEHIGDIIDTVQKLVDQGFAYESNGDVYFDVTRAADYGKLSNRRLEDQEGQRSLRSGEKRHPGDFALWKAAKPEEPQEVKFASPWGDGRPGWHIECSAMAMRYLGETFDIHGGGLDLIFPHHENEIAQSEHATGKPFARIWMHNGLTRINTKKISKSDADPEMQSALAKMTLHNLLDTYPGELIRFFVLSTHYRRPIEYSEAEIESKRKGLDTFYRLFERVQRTCGGDPYQAAAALRSADSPANTDVRSDELATACDRHTAAFMKAMDDDFNTAGAIAALFEFAGAINRFIETEKLESSGGHTAGSNAARSDGAGSNAAGSDGAASDVAGSNRARSDAARSDALRATARLIAVGRLIGILLAPPQQKAAAQDGAMDRVMNILLEVRRHVRKKKDFETADRIRDLLKEEGIVLEDLPSGTVWRRE